MANSHMTQEQRAQMFWERVDRSGECWLWMGAKRTGYGATSFHRRNLSAHILAWILTHGPVPKETPRVLHSCDQPACCNPAHLYLGKPRECSPHIRLPVADYEY